MEEEQSAENAVAIRQRSYTLREKRDVLQALDMGESVRSVSKRFNIPRRTVRNWKENASAIRESKRSQIRLTLGGQGREEIIPFSHDLVTFMKDARREDKVLPNETTTD